MNFTKILPIAHRPGNAGDALPGAWCYALTLFTWWRERTVMSSLSAFTGRWQTTRLFSAARLVPLGVWLLAGCATARGDVHDPLEPVNRAVFAVNRVVDGLVLEPAAEVYGLVVPRPVRRMVRNLLDHLAAPVVFVNALLQGERERAGITLGRFMINSTLGLFGLFDFAAELGYLEQDEDFGQTLAVWGAGEGVYLVLPLLGPSTVRDFVGSAVDTMLLDPAGLALSGEAQLARLATEAVVTRYELDPLLDDLERSSLDFYAAVRSSYLQRRRAEIRNGAPAPFDDSVYRETPDESFEDPANR